MTPEERNKYYLEVVKKGEGEPEWPRPKEELVVGSQDIGDYTQYFAYHVDLGKTPDDLPPAEIVASENPTPRAAILIDQPHPVVDGSDEEVLELILSKDGHAFAHTASSLETLEDNISRILEIAKTKFKMEVEHFMTTDRVSEAVEKKLDSLEESEGGEEESSEPVDQVVSQSVEVVEEETIEPETAVVAEDPVELADTPAHRSTETPVSSDLSEPEPDSEPIPHVQRHVTGSQIYSSSSHSPVSSGGSGGGRKWLLIPVVLLLLLFGGALYFREALFSGINKVASPVAPTPTPEPTATPTPAPTVERKEYKVRVLNGTSVSGAAGSLSEKLKELGWDVTKTGNNSDQDVVKGFVKAKPKQETAVSVMINDLGGSFEASSEALKETDTVDLEVVIGKE